MKEVGIPDFHLPSMFWHSNQKKKKIRAKRHSRVVYCFYLPMFFCLYFSILLLYSKNLSGGWRWGRGDTCTSVLCRRIVLSLRYWEKTANLLFRLLELVECFTATSSAFFPTNMFTLCFINTQIKFVCLNRLMPISLNPLISHKEGPFAGFKIADSVKELFIIYCFLRTSELLLSKIWHYFYSEKIHIYLLWS